ncbi:MAG: SufD family Fe-S cluster assembly protein [Candidatus Poseidoniales archaeon]|jgi:Fe-S cluster assembly scaffold protein SufB
MNPGQTYLSLEEPKNSNHLWRYSPWKKVHPTGNIKEIPEDFTIPEVSLFLLDGSDISESISIVKEDIDTRKNTYSDPVSMNFIDAVSSHSKFTLEVKNNTILDQPVILKIDSGNSNSAMNLTMKIGIHCELELVTQIVGSAPWFGLLRNGEIGEGTIINDILVGQMSSGTLLRVDAINIGRDAQVKAGSISSGSERTKSDIRYMMNENGGNLRVLGSILSADKMHIDHHIEIHHQAPNTFSRLDWHSACGGNSRTIGTGMLRVSDGAKGADAGQLFHNLLLSKKAEADSIPELEVSEHDVVGCGHGTANGPIDEQQLFYLEARGYSPGDAKDALIAAFLNSTLSEMGSETLHQWLAGNLQDKLKSLTT